MITLPRSALGRARRRSLRAVAVYLCLVLPGGVGAQDIDVASVAQGAASFSASDQTTTIHASDGAVIEYHRFDVATAASVRFVQPAPSSRVLNRVIGSDPSAILGRVEANGIVYLVNPAGVVFGPNAVVDAAGFHAAAGRLSNEDFSAGEDRFTNLTAPIENYGTIRAEAFVHLTGQSVLNHGSIVVTAGVSSLSSGDHVFLREGSDGILVHVDDTAGPTGPGVGVENHGRVEANDVFFAAGDLYSLAIAHRGTVRAADRAGFAATGEVRVSGEIAARRVAISGESVVLQGASIDATGPSDGGTIELGGGPHSTGWLGEDTPATVRLFVDGDSVIRADGVDSGSGGRVTLWSEAATLFAGDISATGGETGGDGGFVEVSSRGWLGFAGTVDASAPHGSGGVLLLDPDDIEVVNGGSSALTDVDAFLDPGSDPLVSRIDPATLASAGATVTLEARDTITISDPIELTTDGAGLTARAGGTVTVDAPISTRRGTVSLTANDATSGSSTGSGSIVVNAPITTDTGGVGAGDVELIVDGGAGAITLGGDVTAAGSIQITGPAFLAGGAGGSTRRIEGGGAVVFAGTVDGQRRLLVVAPSAETTFSAAIGSSVPLSGLVTDVGGGTRLAGDVTTRSDGVDLRDGVLLDGDVMLRTLGGGDLRLGSTVDSAGAPRELTLLTLDASGSQVAGPGRIELGGAIGASSPLAVLRLNQHASVSARATIPETATIVGERDVSLRANGPVTVGTNEKWTTLGALEIASGSTISVGDLSALGSITLNGAAIVIQRRSGAVVRDAADREFFDGGVDVVSGGVLAFVVEPTVAGSGANPVFATPSGSGDALGTLAGFPSVSFGQVVLGNLIGSSGSVTGRVLDLAVFSTASESGVPAILASTIVEPWRHASLFGPFMPTTPIVRTSRIRRHRFSSWIEWSQL